MIALRKAVFRTNFLMVKLIELEHLCSGTTTLKSLQQYIKRLQQKKKATQKDDDSVMIILIRVFYLGNKDK